MWVVSAHSWHRESEYSHYYNIVEWMYDNPILELCAVCAVRYRATNLHWNDNLNDENDDNDTMTVCGIVIAKFIPISLCVSSLFSRSSFFSSFCFQIFWHSCQCERVSEWVCPDFWPSIVFALARRTFLICLYLIFFRLFLSILTFATKVIYFSL